MRVVDKDQLKPCLKLGFDLIPIKKWDAKANGLFVGKAPRDNRWVIQPYEKSEIIDWIKEGGNVGVRLRKTELVIDVDPKHKDAKGRNAKTLLEDLELELGIDLSACPIVETGSGGYHVYLTIPDETRVRNSTEVFGGAIEFKSYGRQVLAPGSKHPNGNHYRWVQHETGPVPACPAPLLAMIAKPNLPKRERAPGEEIAIDVLEQCLEQLEPTDFQDYEKWRNLMFSVHYACNGSEEGREAFSKWSTADPKYASARESIDTFWEYASDNRSDARTEKTLFWYVSEAGGHVPYEIDKEFPDELNEPLPAAGTPESRERPMLEVDKQGKVKHTIAQNVILACQYYGLGITEDVFSGKRYLRDQLGLLKQHFEWVDDGAEYTDQMTELVALAITRENHKIDPGWMTLPWSGDPAKATMKRAKDGLVQREHPLQKWLTTREWDGTKRLETWLINCSDLEDTQYNRAVSKLMLTSAVARAMQPGIKFDSMIILEGPQGGYKSSLIKHLGGQWAAEGLPAIGGYNEKDVISAMRGKWIIEIDELASMKKADVDVLKSFLSKTEDRVRLPYEEETRTFPRQCVFIGTTNDAEYLRDITGNRRFLPMRVGMIRDHLEVPREELWAEAYHTWYYGARGEIALPMTEREAAEREQELRRVRDPWEDKLDTFLNEKYAGENFLSTDTVFHDCLRRDLDQASTTDARRLAQVMQKLGWERTRKMIDGRLARGYKRKDED